MLYPEKIYCINLNRRKDRWEAASRQFDIYNLKVERFPAIDANDFKRIYPIDNANNGCTLSHYFIVERAKFLGFNSIIIFEDDVELHPDFNTILELCLNELPEEWDMLYFGGSHRETPSQLSKFLLRVNKTLTTHGYIIRNTMYNRVIDNFKNLDNPVDCLYAIWQKECNVYVTNPPIAWQRESFSDIVGREMSYPWIRSNEQ